MTNINWICELVAYSPSLYLVKPATMLLLINWHMSKEVWAVLVMKTPTQSIWGLPAALISSAFPQLVNNLIISYQTLNDAIIYKLTYILSISCNAASASELLAGPRPNYIL